MFTIDLEARVTPYSGSEATSEDSGTPIHSQTELAAFLNSKSGEWSVALWNQLPGVTLIYPPPGEPSAKFRNKQTAVERIWRKLCELYPAAVLHPAITEDVPKAKTTSRPRAAKQATNGTGRKSAWAEELQQKLTEEFRAGQEFNISQVYEFVPYFKKLHRDNGAIEAKLRQTLSVLRGQGVLKQTGRGKYERKAAR
jgi:Dam-replacing HTH domain